MYVNAFCFITIKITVNNQELGGENGKILGEVKDEIKGRYF